MKEKASFWLPVLYCCSSKRWNLNSRWLASAPAPSSSKFRSGASLPSPSFHRLCALPLPSFASLCVRSRALALSPCARLAHTLWRPGNAVAVFEFLIPPRATLPLPPSPLPFGSFSLSAPPPRMAQPPRPLLTSELFPICH